MGAATEAEGDCGTGGDAPDGPETAPLLTPPVACVVSFSSNYDIDWFRYHAYAGQSIAVTIPPNELDMYPQPCLVDPAGETAACNWGHPSWTKHVTTIAGSTGEWRLSIESVFKHFATPGPYDLLLTVEGETPDAPHDDCGTGAGAGNAQSAATPLATPVSCVGAVDGVDRSDWYHVYAREGQRLYANLTPPAGADFDLCISSRCSRNASDATERVLIEAVPTTAWWAVHVRSVTGAGNYSFEAAVVGEPVNEAPRMQDVRCAGARVEEPVACTFRADDDSSGIAYVLRWSDGTNERVPETGFVPPGTAINWTHTFSTPDYHYVMATAEDNADPPRRDTSWYGSGFMVRAYPSAQDDCGTGGEAGNDAATASALTLPFSRCAGKLEQLGWADDADWYAFDLAAGDEVRASADAGDREIWMCLFAPGNAWEAEACGLGGLEHTVAVGGRWTLEVVGDNWPRANFDYNLSAAIRHQTFEGVFSLAHAANDHGVGATALLGPDANGVDGAWVDLAAEAQGRESITIDTDGWGGQVNVRFHDAAGAEVGTVACEPRTPYERGAWCTVPTGAVRGFLYAPSLLSSDVPYRVTYHY